MEANSDLPQDITAKVDELIYRSYAHNRTISPNVSPERWIKAYGYAAVEMEQRYMRESQYSTHCGACHEIWADCQCCNVPMARA